MSGGSVLPASKKLRSWPYLKQPSCTSTELLSQHMVSISAIKRLMTN